MKKSTRVVAKKVINAVITIFLVLILNFFLFRVMPGNPVKMVIPADPKIPQEYIENLTKQYGLDQPLYIQFFTYMEGVLELDFGNSFENRDTPAMDLVMDKLKLTLLLTGTSSILMIVLGMLIGIVAAWKRGRLFDTGSLAFSLFFYAMPTFWFAMMLIVMFSIEWPIFPPSGATDIGESMELTPESISDVLWHLILPAISLTVGSIAAFSLIMRGSLIDVMTEDYITTARAKGLRNSGVLMRHALPNAMVPMVTLIAMDLAFVVGGAFQTEVVFDYPGIGWETVQATYNQDYPVLQAAFFLIAVVVIFANLFADLLLVYIDPRIKIG